MTSKGRGGVMGVLFIAAILPTDSDNTEGVDEEKLTADALWEAVTGKPGT
ncbi:hypothetical protein GCM10022419_106310 [Nonomuraea rosea]|uniref:Uncharacterized protein n=1 Tax=Nonomuraea rosea TaxID=638574 RepID=A0ABP6ZCG5_9ACTN